MSLFLPVGENEKTAEATVWFTTSLPAPPLTELSSQQSPSVMDGAVLVNSVFNVSVNFSLTEGTSNVTLALGETPLLFLSNLDPMIFYLNVYPSRWQCEYTVIV